MGGVAAAISRTSPTSGRRARPACRTGPAPCAGRPAARSGPGERAVPRRGSGRRPRAPSWAPSTPPTSSRVASTMSTVWLRPACSTPVRAVVMMIWNRLVPTTTRGGHAQHIDHGRHQDEAAADPHDRRQQADEDAERQGRDHADVEPRGWGSASSAAGRRARAGGDRAAAAAARPAGAQDGELQRLRQHQPADDARGRSGRTGRPPGRPGRAAAASGTPRRPGSSRPRRQLRAPRPSASRRPAAAIGDDARHRGGGHMVGHAGHRHRRRECLAAPGTASSGSRRRCRTCRR
jgi:hypothetical protein